MMNFFVSSLKLRRFYMLATNGMIALTAGEAISSQHLPIGLLTIDAASSVDT